MKLKVRVPHSIAELQHHGEHAFHMIYLGAVGYEAHGYYQIAAIVLLIITVIGSFIVTEA